MFQPWRRFSCNKVRRTFSGYASISTQLDVTTIHFKCVTPSLLTNRSRDYP